MERCERSAAARWFRLRVVPCMRRRFEALAVLTIPKCAEARGITANLFSLSLIRPPCTRSGLGGRRTTLVFGIKSNLPKCA